MEKIKANLQNCFGIQEMHHEFDFHGDNVITIYARNGLMKTSFAKTFQMIQNNKADDIGDVIFGDVGCMTVKIDGKQAMMCLLLIHLRACDKLLEALEKSSGLKIKKQPAVRQYTSLRQRLLRILDLKKLVFY